MPNEPQLRLLVLLRWVEVRMLFRFYNLQFDYLVCKDEAGLVEKELSTVVFGSGRIFVR